MARWKLREFLCVRLLPSFLCHSALSLFVYLFSSFWISLLRCLSGWRSNKIIYIDSMKTFKWCTTIQWASIKNEMHKRKILKKVLASMMNIISGVFNGKRKPNISTCVWRVSHLLWCVRARARASRNTL